MSRPLAKLPYVVRLPRVWYRPGHSIAQLPFGGRVPLAQSTYVAVPEQGPPIEDDEEDYDEEEPPLSEDIDDDEEDKAGPSAAAGSRGGASSYSTNADSPPYP